MRKPGESSKNPFIQVRKFRSPDHEKKSAKILKMTAIFFYHIVQLSICPGYAPNKIGLQYPVFRELKACSHYPIQH